MDQNACLREDREACEEGQIEPERETLLDLAADRKIRIGQIVLAPNGDPVPDPPDDLLIEREMVDGTDRASGRTASDRQLAGRGDRQARDPREPPRDTAG